MPASQTARLDQVRVFGATESLPILTTPSWPDDEYHGWEMTAIAAKIVGAKGGYRAPRASGGYSYYIFTDIRFAGGAGEKLQLDKN